MFKRSGNKKGFAHKRRGEQRVIAKVIFDQAERQRFKSRLDSRHEMTEDPNIGKRTYEGVPSPDAHSRNETPPTSPSTLGSTLNVIRVIGCEKMHFVGTERDGMSLGASRKPVWIGCGVRQDGPKDSL